MLHNEALRQTFFLFPRDYKLTFSTALQMCETREVLIGKYHVKYCMLRNVLYIFFNRLNIWGPFSGTVINKYRKVLYAYCQTLSGSKLLTHQLIWGIVLTHVNTQWFLELVWEIMSWLGPETYHCLSVPQCKNIEENPIDLAAYVIALQ